MAKTRTPFLSLDAHGSVGGSLTAQHLGSSTLVREKPLPTDPRSLSQAYQRWLYEDYAHLWSQQSSAITAYYRSAGVRFHLTGFQYWMKVMLTRFDHIEGIYRLDDFSAGKALDSSPHERHATVQGATLSDGYIGRCVYFDGLNDYINFSRHFEPLTTVFSVEFIFKPTAWTGWHWLLTCGSNSASALGWQIDFNGDLSHLEFTIGNTRRWLVWALDGKAHHIWCLYDGPNSRQEIYLDGIFVGVLTAPVDLFVRASGLDLISGKGSYYNGGWYKGYLDNLIIYDRLPTQEEITLHSARRYPS